MSENEQISAGQNSYNNYYIRNHNSDSCSNSNQSNLPSGITEVRFVVLTEPDPGEGVKLVDLEPGPDVDHGEQNFL